MMPEALMRSDLEEVVVQGRLDLIDALSNAGMVDQANQAVCGPPGRAGLVSLVKGFRRNMGGLAITVERIAAGDTWPTAGFSP
ncbi:MAG: hypothetical protein QE285_00585 [Aquabacterium sp.]|nr:hypothetical protein [Aquabacterium sp.]